MKIEKVITLKTVDSTNSYIARENIADNTCVRALWQSAGRGRLGRSFLSPEGGLYFSFVFTPKDLSLVTVAAAVAVAKCVPHSGIKWPNDILINGKKACGILCQGNNINGRVIVGIGINVNSAPIQGACFVGGDADSLFNKVLISLQDTYTLLENDPDRLLEQYDKLLLTKNQTVKVQSPNGIITGVATGINRKGELMVFDGQMHAINSGEATIIKNDSRKE